MHYVVQVKIIKVTSEPVTTTASRTERLTEEELSLTAKADDLCKAIDKAKRHLAVHDREA